MNKPRRARNVIKISGLTKEFNLPGQQIKVLSGVNLAIARGAKLAITGPSGTGKTTLLTLLGGLDRPSRGKVLWEGQDLSRYSANRLARLRNGKVGFVYQFHHLLLEFTALENAAMPLLVGGMSPREAQTKAAKMLDLVGLARRKEHKPAELSGGERQRVAVARALAGKPICVMMDEPTGNLDDETAQAMHQLLVHLATDLEIALVVVTHDSSLADLMDQKYVLSGGKLTKAAKAVKQLRPE